MVGLGKERKGRQEEGKGKTNGFYEVEVCNATLWSAVYKYNHFGIPDKRVKNLSLKIRSYFPNFQ